MNAGLIGIAMVTALVVVGCDLREKEDKEIVQGIIENMVPIPGKDFKIGKYEVTQTQWLAVMDDLPSENCLDDNNPVENVSWDDCKEFIEKLNALPEVRASGLVFRFPTEAEWEFACRAGGTGQYCRLFDGTEITKDTLAKVAWYDKNGGGTHPVGQKMPNAFGLYDMHGNVYEWCEDLYSADSSNRVYRGGCWFYDAKPCMAGYRWYYPPNTRNNRLGFRLAASSR